MREAEEIGNRVAGRKHDIPESCIRGFDFVVVRRTQANTVFFF